MRLFKILMRFEWEQFKRQSILFISLACFLLTGLYGIYRGNTLIKNQRVVIDSVSQNYSRNQELYHKNLLADTTTTEGRSASHQAAIPEVLNYKLSPVAVFSPFPLAGLATGQRDIKSYYSVVKKENDFSELESEIYNPVKLAAGNFDLAFVLVYLLPLLIIVFCYNVISQEKEQGTHSLLLVQKGGMHHIIILKLLFRFFIIGSAMIILNFAGALWSARVVSFDMGSLLLWQYISILYMVFWFAVSYTVILLKENSQVNAMTLLGTWLTFLIILPALTNIYVSLRYPLPMQSGFASYKRHISNDIWNMDRRSLLDTFYQNNPTFKDQHLPADTGQYSSKRGVAYYDLLERKLTAKAAELTSSKRLHNDASYQLSSFNPAVKTLQLYSEIAGTSQINYTRFKGSIDGFRQSWKDYINKFLMYDKSVSNTDFENLPAYKSGEIKPNYLIVLKGSLSIVLTAIFLIIIGRYISSKKRSDSPSR